MKHLHKFFLTGKICLGFIFCGVSSIEILNFQVQELILHSSEEISLSSLISTKVSSNQKLMMVAQSFFVMIFGIHQFVLSSMFVVLLCQDKSNHFPAVSAYGSASTAICFTHVLTSFHVVTRTSG